jgi:hypothetical protein
LRHQPAPHNSTKADQDLSSSLLYSFFKQLKGKQRGKKKERALTEATINEAQS